MSKLKLFLSIGLFVLALYFSYQRTVSRQLVGVSIESAEHGELFLPRYRVKCNDITDYYICFAIFNRDDHYFFEYSPYSPSKYASCHAPRHDINCETETHHFYHQEPHIRTSVHLSSANFNNLPSWQLVWLRAETFFLQLSMGEKALWQPILAVASILTGAWLGIQTFLALQDEDRLFLGVRASWNTLQATAVSKQTVLLFSIGLFAGAGFALISRVLYGAIYAATIMLR